MPYSHLSMKAKYLILPFSTWNTCRDQIRSYYISYLSFILGLPYKTPLLPAWFHISLSASATEHLMCNNSQNPVVLSCKSVAFIGPNYPSEMTSSNFFVLPLYPSMSAITITTRTMFSLYWCIN